MQALRNVAMDRVDRRTGIFNDVLCNPPEVLTSSDNYLGIDLGTSSIVLSAVDPEGEPVYGSMEAAEVIRDGVILDYTGTREIVKKMLGRYAGRAGKEALRVATAYPPGTDPRVPENVVLDSGPREVEIIDEPSAAALKLNLLHKFMQATLKAEPTRMPRIANA